jgi:serine/threonine protein kinase
MSSTPGTSVGAAPVAFGKYQLVERLGRGGMAEVWKARMVGPAGFQRTLVVKRILPHLVEDPHFVEMFVSEARLSARLNHVNIVQVYELGDVAGEYFLAMEYVRGRDLVNVMRAQLMRGHPDPGLGAYAMREVCRALAYAHALTDDNGTPFRLIHRDVSPSNVMLSFDGAVKLLDFGIAKALAEATENKTQTGTLKGKFGYMSPEQVEGRDFDHRADLFAAGVVLHESLSGRRLFKGSSDLQTIAMVRDAKVDAPSVINPNVPPELDRIALKALARNPDDRYPSCEEMAFDLDQVVHQLKWGPEKLKPILRDLFADEPSNTGNLVAVQNVGSGLTIGTLRQHERRKIAAYVAAGLVAVGGIAWLVTARARRPPEMKRPVVAAPVAPVVTPLAQPAVVRVRVASNPPGAEVFLDGDETARGLTPLTMMIPRGDAPRKLTLKAKGFRAESADVVPDSDGTLQISLSAAAAPPSPAKKLAKRPVVVKKKPPAADLKRGDVVDPFGR